ncbi:MAG TPA: hypothetical protein VFS67_07035 [Polyangiaceae bacterium]|jgi:hypothetical protein|nr:hypothetical protein [Polyangiaceae bacterium]
MLPSARGVLLTLFSCLFSGLAPAIAAAQQTPYCKQVRARAASDADYLMAPRVIVQGLHFPHGSELADSGPVLGSGYQLRTGLTFSPVDFYKGRGVLRAGDADCKRHEAAAALDDVLGHATESARLSALLQQGEFLRGHTEDWRNISARAAARLSQRIITVVDFNNVQRSIDGLEHKLVQVDGEAEQLKARQLRVSGMLPSGNGLGTAKAEPDAAAVPDLASEYFRQSMRYERETSQVRRLDDWKLQITGGVIPLYPVDWYGTVELSFSLGALVRGQHEERYIEGRSEDLRYARDGVETRLAQFRAQASAALEQARRDLGLVDHSLEVLRATRLALEQSEAESAAQARDLIAVEQVSVESESVFLRSFVGALEALMARARG